MEYVALSCNCIHYLFMIMHFNGHYFSKSATWATTEKLVRKKVKSNPKFGVAVSTAFPWVCRCFSPIWLFSSGGIANRTGTDSIRKKTWTISALRTKTPGKGLRTFLREPPWEYRVWSQILKHSKHSHLV